MHGSLVGIGILWLLLSSRQSGAAVVPGPPEPKVQITPVKLLIEPSPVAAKPTRSSSPQAVSPRRAQTRPQRVSVSHRSSAPEASKPGRPESPRLARTVASRPLTEGPAYPTASRPRTAPEQPSRPASRRPRPQRTETAPLWSGEDVAPSEPADSSGTPGQGDSRGLIVDARPKGRVKLQTPAFMKLVRARVVARFEVSKDGKTERVTLDMGTGIPATDAEILAFLATVEWTPKTISGVAVPDVQVMTFARTESTR